MSWFKSRDERRSDKLDKLCDEHKEAVKNKDIEYAQAIDREIRRKKKKWKW